MKHGNPTRMDIAALDFTGIEAVTPANRKPNLRERIEAAWAPKPKPAPVEYDPYVWIDTGDFDAIRAAREAGENIEAELASRQLEGTTA